MDDEYETCDNENEVPQVIKNNLRDKSMTAVPMNIFCFGW